MGFAVTRRDFVVARWSGVSRTAEQATDAGGQRSRFLRLSRCSGSNAFGVVGYRVAVPLASEESSDRRAVVRISPESLLVGLCRPFNCHGCGTAGPTS